MISPFPWPGGKRALVRTLISAIPAHRIYVEVFAGSAKLLFAKKPSELEVINDVNGDVTNFFRVAKHRAAELAERFEIECLHAGRFRELVESPGSACEIERALRFAYLAWFSFGGKGQHFARPSVKDLRLKRSLDTVRGLLNATSSRLARVLIDQRDYADILDRYDTKETFFYLDPPYVEYSANGRYAPMTAERRAEMFAQLARVKAKWLMSFEDHAEAREAAKRYGFTMRKVGVLYTLSGQAKRKQVSELLISNFRIAA